jgi:hydroxyacylglutathione hydrolase
MNMNSVITIPAFSDNYVYVYASEDRNGFVVDPGDGPAVLHLLRDQGLQLTAVLATHHHFDHVGGIAELKKKTGCDVIGPDRSMSALIDRGVEDNQVIEVGSSRINVISTPGHTRRSVCYYVLPSENQRGILFTGDTLFIGGCGRPIECNAQTMWNSLQKIASLPDDTEVYPGHDYSEENYEFALTIEPNNSVVRNCLQRLREKQRQGRPTVPSTIAQEKASNIFLRADEPEIKKALGMRDATAAHAFAELRHRKNLFG